MALTGKKILITGGAGFIGSALTESFLQQGNRVVCLDNFSTGFRSNIEPFLKDPDYTLIEGDIRDDAACEKAAEGAEIVFHEAALGSVPRSIQDPVTSIDVNILGFTKILYAAVRAKVKRFVYASSSSVYGDSEKLPKTEPATGHPLSPYAVSKAADELIAGNFHKVYGISVAGLRYFNVFGRRQSPAGAYAAVIPRFARALLEHRSPVINGDGSYSRDFTYIDNVVQANQLAAEVAEENLNEARIFNIAAGGRMTILRLFETLREALSKMDPAAADVKPQFGPTRTGDIPHSFADISLAQRILGYHPQFTAEQGLRLASEWYFRSK